MVQQPLNPGVLEVARQLLDRTALRWPDALQLGAALTARDMFPGTEITFVTALEHLREVAGAEGFEAVDPDMLPIAELQLAPQAEALPEAPHEGELAGADERQLNM